MESLSTKPTIKPAFKTGNGSWLTTSNGKHYFDATSGSGAVSLGHQHASVVNACMNQIGNLIHTGCKLNSAVRAELAEKISKLVPIQNASVLFSVIGTEAVESAFKIARSYTGRSKIICFEHAYHGKSRDALGTTWRSSFKEFSQINHDDYVRFAIPYASSSEYLAESEGGDPALQKRVDAALAEYKSFLAEQRQLGDQELPAAFVVEPIQVTEGVLFPPRKFVEGLISLSRQYGVVSIIDEIYTAFGRCGALFYCDTIGQKPDLILLGKSLANGMPISLVAGDGKIMQSLPSGTQTSTYSGSPLSAAAALAVINYVTENQVWLTAQENGQWMKNILEEMKHKYAIELEIRQCGMLSAFEFKTGDTVQTGMAKKFISLAFANGLLLFGGGYNNENVKLIPPILLDQEEKEFLETSLDKTFNDLLRKNKTCHIKIS